MKFADIPGHEGVKEQLRNLVADNNIPHALLLEGPAGVGKLSLIRAFAQYIHCTNRHDGDSCGKCPSCLQHQSFNHIDTYYVYPVVKDKGDVTSRDFAAEWREFLSIDPYASFSRWITFFDKKNANPMIYVSESNEIVRSLSYTTHGAEYRIVIFWLPERMNEEAANKILKVLEEPFPDTIFLIASDEPAKILPTVYSRMRRLEVKRLNDDVIADYLVDNEGLDRTDALAMAHLAEGSITTALSHIQSKGDGELFLDLFISLMRNAYQRKVKELRDWSQKIDSLGRERAAQFYDYAQRLIRENFIYNFGNPDIVYMNRAETNFSNRFARFIHERNAERLCEVMNDAKRDILGNGNGKIINFDLAVRCIFLLKR